MTSSRTCRGRNARILAGGGMAIVSCAGHVLLTWYVVRRTRLLGLLSDSMSGKSLQRAAHILNRLESPTPVPAVIQVAHPPRDPQSPQRISHSRTVVSRQAFAA